MNDFIKQLPYKPDDYQLEAFELLDNLPQQRNALIIWPTGCGKSVVAEYTIDIACKKNKRVIYTTPLKALSTEKRDEWGNNGVNVLRDTSDDRSIRDDKTYDDFDVLITTNERLDVILRSSSLRYKVFKNVSHVVVDEIHLLGSKGRGSTIEFIIMVLREIMPHITIIGLSATLPNYKEFAAWLNADYHYLPPEKRPIPLHHHFTEPVPAELNTRETENQKYFSMLKTMKTYPNDQFLVFVSSRLRAENIAKRKAGNLRGKVPIKTLIRRDNCYHHAGLNEKERSLVEQAFRSGKIKYLFATPTLAQGINLPARNVVMFDLSRWSIFTSSHELIEHYEIGQMSGRAGRRGFDTLGRCFYLGKKHEMAYARESVDNPRPMISQIDDWLDDKILALVVSNLSHNIDGVKKVFEKSFLAHDNDNAITIIDENIDFLVSNYFLWREKDGFLSPTKFGSLASKIYIKPRTANEVYDRIMELGDDPSELDIIKVFLQNGELLSSIRVSDMDKHYIDGAISSFNLYNEKVLVNVYNPFSKRYELVSMKDNFCKLMGLIFSGDLGITVYGSKKELSSLRKTASEQMSKLNTVLLCRPDAVDKMKNWGDKTKTAIAMIQHGIINHDKLKIALVPGIGSVRLSKLISRGIDSISKFFNTDNQQLSTILHLNTDIIAKMKVYISNNKML